MVALAISATASVSTLSRIGFASFSSAFAAATATLAASMRAVRSVPPFVAAFASFVSVANVDAFTMMIVSDRRRTALVSLYARHPIGNRRCKTVLEQSLAAENLASRLLIATRTAQLQRR